MDREQIRRVIEGAVPGAEVIVHDLTGTGDHFQVVVVSEAFSGKPMVEQHKMVYAPLREALAEQIHALTLKTYTPEEVSKL